MREKWKEMKCIENTYEARHSAISESLEKMKWAGISINEVCINNFEHISAKSSLKNICHENWKRVNIWREVKGSSRKLMSREKLQSQSN